MRWQSNLRNTCNKNWLNDKITISVKGFLAEIGKTGRHEREVTVPTELHHGCDKKHCTYQGAMLIMRTISWTSVEALLKLIPGREKTWFGQVATVNAAKQGSPVWFKSIINGKVNSLLFLLGSYKQELALSCIRKVPKKRCLLWNVSHWLNIK